MEPVRGHREEEGGQDHEIESRSSEITMLGYTKARQISPKVR